MTFNITEAVPLEVARCYECGRYYGFERGHSEGCPKCVGVMWRKSQAALLERDRTIAALRGALTKAKRR